MCALHKINYIDLLGKEFGYGGRGPDYYDCWGLCMEVYKRLGMQLPDGISTPEFADIEKQINSGFEIFQEIQAPEPYCLVTFMIRPPYTSHVGVVLDDCRQFIHIMQKCKVVVEKLDNMIWHRRIRGFYRVSPLSKGA